MARSRKAARRFAALLLTSLFAAAPALACLAAAEAHAMPMPAAEGCDSEAGTDDTSAPCWTELAVTSTIPIANPGTDVCNAPAGAPAMVAIELRAAAPEPACASHSPPAPAWLLHNALLI